MSLPFRLVRKIPNEPTDGPTNNHRQSMELVGGVTLLLDFNLLLLSNKKKKKKKEVSKLSNSSSDSDGLLLGATNDSRTVEDLTDADGRACSSASADSIAVAENRRPSTVTVLQTWTCPCQGKIIVLDCVYFLSVCAFLIYLYTSY